VRAIEEEAAAWEHFLALLRGLPDPVDFVTHGWLASAPPRIAEADARLADFVRRCPGAFERRLGAVLEDPELGALLGRYPLLQIRGALRQTLDALDPATLLRLLGDVRGRLDASMLNKVVALFAEDCARRVGADALFGLPLAPELRDALRCKITGEPLPDILPEDVHEMSADEIGEALAAYMGTTIAALQARLEPGGVSRAGFLAPGERIGEVIRRDASALHRLGVGRHVLAERLEGAWELEPVIGYQHDPFHACDVYEQTRRGGAMFVITNQATGERLRGGDLLALLIRRACFFEGSVPYRVSPEALVRVLGFD
jgi:hypothetical protein